MKCLAQNGFSPELISQIEIDNNDKPFIKKGPYFNISHSSSLIACALSRNYPLGIDVEEIRDIKVENFIRYLHKNEWILMEKNNFDKELFFDAWTRKEAVLKADGIGMRIPLVEIDTTQETIHIKGKMMKVKKINMKDSFAAHLAMEGVEDFSYSCEELKIC